MVDSPSEHRRWLQDGISQIQKVAAVELGLCGALQCFQGTGVYIGEGSTSVEQREAHEGGGRAGHPRGRLACCLMSTSSLQVGICSKKIAPKGFIPFGLPVIFLFFETLK